MKRLGVILKRLWHGAGELSPSCRAAARLQSEALDRELRPSERVGLRIHLLLCKWCRRYGRQIQFLRSAARRSQDQEQGLPKQVLRPEVRERIKQCLKADDHT